MQGEWEVGTVSGSGTRSRPRHRLAGASVPIAGVYFVTFIATGSHWIARFS